jgi:magnesium transporter
MFEADLKNAVALALFIPVVLSLGESVSIQSLTISLQLLHGQKPSWGRIVKKLSQELLVGLMLGIGCGIVVSIVALAWINELRLMLCILGGIAGGVGCSAVLGAMVPNLLHRLKLDPRVAAGPLALTTSDICTLLCYFSLARWLLS